MRKEELFQRSLVWMNESENCCLCKRLAAVTLIEWVDQSLSDRSFFPMPNASAAERRSTFVTPESVMNFLLPVASE